MEQKRLSKNRCRTKAELAKLFGVHRTTIWRYFKMHKKLSDELKATGYNPNNKIFTPLQLKIISKYLGAFDTDEN